MAGVYFLSSWFKAHKEKFSPKKKKGSPKRGAHDVSKNSPPSRACLCRATMTLPPTPCDLARDGTRLVWGRSCVDSPPHLYEEIPENNDVTHVCDVIACPYAVNDVTGQDFDDPDEYLQPTPEVSFVGPQDVVQNHSIVPQKDRFDPVLNVDLCKYDKISPLSALGLTMASLKKCSRCHRPHGVYNGTVYRHGGSNSSPDLVKLDWHLSNPSAGMATPTEGGACGIATPLSQSHRFYSTSDLHCYNQQKEAVKENSNCENLGNVIPGSSSKAEDKFSSAFQVLKPSGHRRLAGLVLQDHLVKPSTSGNPDYDHHLAKVKQHFELGKGVSEITRTDNSYLRSRSESVTSPPSIQDGRYEHPIKSPVTKDKRKSLPPLPPGVTPRNQKSTSMMNLNSNTERYTPLQFPSGNSDSGRFHTLSKYRTVRSKLEEVGAQEIDKLSCRATNFRLTKPVLGDRRRSSLSRESVLYESSVYGCHGNVQRTNHNPLLSDIMRRNHDRQNLVL